MNIFHRILGPLLVSASLVLAATGCTDDGSDAEIDVAVPGDTTHGWALVGPAERAEKLAERLALDVGAPTPFRHDGTAAPKRQYVIEVPHATWVDPARLEEIAAQEGFVMLEGTSTPASTPAAAQ